MLDLAVKLNIVRHNNLQLWWVTLTGRKTYRSLKQAHTYLPLALAALTLDSRSWESGCTAPGILAASVKASRASLTRLNFAYA